MASTYTPALGLELIATGELAGQWGTETNFNLENVIEYAITATGTLQFTADANQTFNVTQNVAVTAAIRAPALIFTSAGALTATRTALLASASGAGISRLIYAYNNTTGSQSIVVKTTAGGVGVTVPAGKRVLLKLDATDVVEPLQHFVSGITLGVVLPVASGGTGGGTVAAGLAGLGISGTFPRNFVPNGGMQIAQRCVLTTAANALGVTLTNAGAYNYGLVDRMKVSVTSTTLSAGSFTQASTSLCGRTGYAAKLSGLTTTGATAIAFRTHIEAADAAKLVNDAGSTGQNVYISLIVAQDTGGALNYTVELRRADAADNFGATTQIAISGSQSVVSATPTTIVLAVAAATMANAANQNGLQINVAVSPGAVTTKNFEWAELQLEQSTVQTPFEYTAFAFDLARCQRVFNKTFPYATAPAQAATFDGAIMEFGTGQRIVQSFEYHTRMRVSPTVHTFNPAIANANWRDATAGADSTVSVITDASNENKATISTSGATTGSDAYYIQVASDADF